MLQFGSELRPVQAPASRHPATFANAEVGQGCPLSASAIDNLLKTYPATKKRSGCAAAGASDIFA
jgi:hypothetical protein